MENIKDQRGEVPQDKDDSDGTYSPSSSHSIPFEEQCTQLVQVLPEKKKQSLTGLEDFFEFSSDMDSENDDAVNVNDAVEKSCLEIINRLNHNRDGDNVDVTAVENNEDRTVEPPDDNDVIACTPPPSPPSTVQFEEQSTQIVQVLPEKRKRTLSGLEDFFGFISDSEDDEASVSQQPKKLCLKNTTNLDHNNETDNVGVKREVFVSESSDESDE